MMFVYNIYTNILYMVSLVSLVTSTAFSRPILMVNECHWRVCSGRDDAIMTVREVRPQQTRKRQVSARYSAIDGAEDSCCDGEDSDHCTDQVKTIISVLCSRRRLEVLYWTKNRVSVDRIATNRRTMYLYWLL